MKMCLEKMVGIVVFLFFDHLLSSVSDALISQSIKFT